jgi:predicted nucleotidyltransferase
MNRGRPLPADIEGRLASLGDVLGACPGVAFAYLFGGAAGGRLTPLSDIDVAVFFEEGFDLEAGRLEALECATRHLGTDEVDLVVLNTAPSALLARILPGRRVLCDRVPYLRHRFESIEVRKAADFRIFERRLLERRFGRG